MTHFIQSQAKIKLKWYELIFIFLLCSPSTEEKKEMKEKPKVTEY